MELQLYSDSFQEKKELNSLCMTWGFWNYAETSRTLDLNASNLLYVKHPKTITADSAESREDIQDISTRPTQDSDATENWAGAIFFQSTDVFSDLLFIYVAPSVRRSGTGYFLLKGMIKFLNSPKKKHDIFLEVRASNKIARHLYEKLGMKIDKRRKSYYRDGGDGIIYRLSL